MPEEEAGETSVVHNHVHAPMFGADCSAFGCASVTVVCLTILAPARMGCLPW